MTYLCLEDKVKLRSFIVPRLVGWVEQRETHRTMMGFAVALPILQVFYRPQSLRGYDRLFTLSHLN